MSESKNYHVVPHPEGWAVRGENAERAAAVVPTQREAIDLGRGITQRQGTELFIHGENGQIRERDSHGRDSVQRRG